MNSDYSPNELDLITMHYIIGAYSELRVKKLSYSLIAYLVGASASKELVHEKDLEVQQKIQERATTICAYDLFDIFLQAAHKAKIAYGVKAGKRVLNWGILYVN